MSTQDDHSNQSTQERLRSARTRQPYADPAKKADEQSRDDAWAKINASVNSEASPEASYPGAPASQSSTTGSDSTAGSADSPAEGERSYYGDRRYSGSRNDRYDRRDYLEPDRTRRMPNGYNGTTYIVDYDSEAPGARGASDEARTGDQYGRIYAATNRSSNQYSPRSSYGQRSYNGRNGYDYQSSQDDRYRDGYRRNSYGQDDYRAQSRRPNYRYDSDGSNYGDRGYQYPQSYRPDPRRDYNAPPRNYSYGRNDRYQGSGRDQTNFRAKPRKKKRGKLEPTIGATGRRGEPITVAELVAGRIAQGQTYGQLSEDIRGQFSPSIIEELEKLPLSELVSEARRQNVDSYSGDRRKDLLIRILRARIESAGYLFGEGTLEILPDGFGFLRSKKARYQPSSDDVYVSPSQIRRFGLRAGLHINGQIRPPKCLERYFALLRVEAINGGKPDSFVTAPVFEDLVVVRPSRRISFDSKKTKKPDLDMRALDIVAPIGFGHRALITAPAEVADSDASDFVSKMVQNVLANYPDVNIVSLLIGKSEEEIKRIEESFADSRCEIAATTDQESSARHMQIAEIAFEKAKRFVEFGQDVVLVIDSLPAFLRAWRQESANREAKIEHETENGNISLVKKLTAQSTNRPKKLFSLARETDNGGTLTIIALAKLENSDEKENAFDEEALKDFTSVCNTIVYLQPGKASGSGAALDVKRCYAQDARNLFEVADYVKYEALASELRTAKTADKAERELRDQVKKVDDPLEALRTLKSKKQS